MNGKLIIEADRQITINNNYWPGSSFQQFLKEMLIIDGDLVDQRSLPHLFVFDSSCSLPGDGTGDSGTRVNVSA